MRYYRNFMLLCAVLFVNHMWSQKAIVAVDSVAYYLTKAKENQQSGTFEQATAFAQNSKKYAIRNSKKKDLAESYLILGSINLDQKNPESAIENYKRSLAIFNSLNILSKVANSNYNLGIAYSAVNNFEMAKSHFISARANFKKINNKHSNQMDMVDLQLAILYAKNGDIEISKNILTKLHFDPEDRFSYNLNVKAQLQLANILQFDSIGSAVKIVEQTYLDNSKIDPELKLEALLTFSQIYERNLSPYMANNYLKQYIKELDIQRHKKNKNSAILNTVLDNNPSQKQTNFHVENDKSIKFSKLISILSIALIAILSLLSLSLYKNNIIRNKTNQLLKSKNSELELAKNNAEKASKARAEFLSTVSHELRTPLNAINGITHILLEEKPKKSQLNYLNSLQFSGNYLLRFINDILEINRVESGVVELEEISYDIRQLLENILDTFTEQAKKNEIIYHLHVDQQIPSVLVGDPTKLSQIFMNLIGNAIKFSARGNIWINIKLVHKKDDFAKLLMEVKDSGIGISPEKKEKIFENFTQGSVEINRKFGGTGLGLAIVKSLVNLLGGTINVDSALNEGACFYFEIYQKIGTEAVIVPVVTKYDAEALVGKRVLLVEDNKINQMITEKMLTKKQMECVIIDNGEDAIVTAKEEHFDLILMDVHLPGINGTIAAQEIRKFDDKTPIIALTAISLNENREMLLSYGMNDVITKPFDPDKFYQIMASYLVENLHTQPI